MPTPSCPLISPLCDRAWQAPRPSLTGAVSLSPRLPPLMFPTCPAATSQAGGVECITEAMEAFPDSLMVQLAGVLSLIPMTLDNSMMQVRGAQGDEQGEGREAAGIRGALADLGSEGHSQTWRRHGCARR
jgi:hypothetical protein